MFEKQINSDIDYDYSDLNEHEFEQSEDACKFLLKFYYSRKNKFELISIILKNCDEQAQCQFERKSFEIDLEEDFKLNKKRLKSRISSLNDYLVLWEEKNKNIFCCNILKNQIFFKIELKFFPKEVFTLSNVNDLVVRGGNMSIHYFQFKKNELIEIQKFKDLNGRLVENISKSEDNIILGLDEKTYFYTNLSSENPTMIVIDKECSSFCFASNQQSLFLFDSKNEELCGFKLNRQIEKFCCIHLDQSIKNLIFYKKYLSGLIDTNLITFEVLC